MKKNMAVDEALKEILSREGASTQEEICQKLSSLGIAMTQSSVSRWLRKVHAIKIPGEKGARYSLPPSVGESNIKRLVFSVRHNSSLIVIRTAPGSASWIASLIDNRFTESILGTLAGDDTIFITPISESTISLIAKDIENFLLVFSD
ncbi:MULTISPECIES: arginine repressor [Chlamydia]|uniref:Arginine repressor n=2 Tax=Chlamydia TaxID=810 RepID=A0ABP2X2C4_CHLPS|nr:MULTISPECIES: arginine repressor [Chlamydia]AFS22784.1 arginine repressor [Chlamydia psittaci VS225]AGE75126.1 arginine repressor [Chlamydia psittaci Mat116]EPJ15447.1 arginine repressor [Chlamydia psittaci 02DC18]EPJ16674.1 arginine repressor [Chlamydia psittaci 02DC22]EPJ20235.1 arginine repressor [Chlamydia psittaci 02DC21]EPJ21329.1 arginine repressor [Chlamydia psittaci 02DC23]EPJ22937.1 arginine repressor [Chlamydia psittaci 03DC29]EPJ24703.1 arginine repressor [Chlamydia psittaci 